MKPDQNGGCCWWCLVGLFLLSLFIVLAWLVQYSLATVRSWRAKDLVGNSAARHLPVIHQDHRTDTGGWRGFLLRLRPGRSGRAVSEAGAKGLLSTLFSFKSFGEPWQRAWVKALNDQACRHGSSIQITFDSTLPLTASTAIERVTCTDQSARSMVLHCDCRLDSVTFPVTVTQQSHAAVSMDTYQVTIEPVVAKLVASLEEAKEGGLLVSWSLSKQPPLALRVSPRKLHKQGAEGEADLNTIKELVEDALYSTQPSLVLSLRSCESSATVTPEHQSGWLTPAPQCVPVHRLTLRQLRATCHKGQWTSPAELCCVLSLDQSSTEKRTGFVCVPGSPACSLGWSEDITLDLQPETKELRIRLLEQSGAREQFLPGQASIALDVGGKGPTGPLTVSVSPGHGLAPDVTVTLELLYVESEGSCGGHSPSSLRSSLTPTKKVDVDRTVMPDGTIVTTVTTVQSRPKERDRGESPLPSPYKVEVTEKGPTVLSDSRGSPVPSLSPPVTNGLDPVAETAIRQLTDASGRVSRKTPTKRSTLIISGVSKAPLSEDDNALSKGYAAAMDAAMHAHHQGALPRPDPDERTPSDASERPSVDDVESDTGSNGVMETRSLKDHKVGFLRSGSKLLFRRRRRDKDPAVSQSHEDLSQTGEGAGAAASAPAASTLKRKSSGSFSRRLIKRFSFRSSGKSKSGGAANGGAGAPGN
ncbi:phospholipid transfer protein C2CD2L [Gadus macrocephalus]|uniref:phospholipid transfer protein C2CD2L n=1 Tax=Gadus macrocephalus TaxID=80720 RepID=UPI0028CB7132|nr:phospholipid transfer protein C2CD2L [Gadus macrocephalus]XP_059912679.1 phospholipid transfer protein C2CD2L [Gadus macrocephalus]XP_059912680.1 phospholipid transfer protein C2CD2L [Gadus macrocephalus]